MERRGEMKEEFEDGDWDAEAEEDADEVEERTQIEPNDIVATQGTALTLAAALGTTIASTEDALSRHIEGVAASTNGTATPTAAAIGDLAPTTDVGLEAVSEEDDEDCDERDDEDGRDWDECPVADCAKVGFRFVLRLLSATHNRIQPIDWFNDGDGDGDFVYFNHSSLAPNSPSDDTPPELTPSTSLTDSTESDADGGEWYVVTRGHWGLRNVPVRRLVGTAVPRPPTPDTPSPTPCYAALEPAFVFEPPTARPALTQTRTSMLEKLAPAFAVTTTSASTPAPARLTLLETTPAPIRPTSPPVPVVRRNRIALDWLRTRTKAREERNLEAQRRIAEAEIERVRTEKEKRERGVREKSRGKGKNKEHLVRPDVKKLDNLLAACKARIAELRPTPPALKVGKSDASDKEN
ncbi:hypothetical protein H0H87_009430, partial [Tephrocybe sp. NHM501043]